MSEPWKGPAEWADVADRFFDTREGLITTFRAAMEATRRRMIEACLQWNSTDLAAEYMAGVDLETGAQGPPVRSE